MKSKIFETSTVTLEFENIVMVKWSVAFCTIVMFGGITHELYDGEEIAKFKIWYNIYLEDKYAEQEEEDRTEEIPL